MDGLGSVDPLLQMVQCQGVVLHESIKIGLTQAIAGIANGVVNREQQKNGAKQAGNQSENVNRKSLDGIKGPTAPQQFKKIDRGFPVYVSEPVSISYIRDPTKTRSHTSLSFDAYNTKVKERQIQAQIDRENRQQAEVVVGMLTFAFPELLAFESEYLFAEQVAVRSIAAKRSTSFAEGSFSVFNWKGYPAGGIKPTGPFRLLEGTEYTSARNLANSTNAAMRRANPEMFKGLQIHEIHPVKFGGSPTDLSNKIFLTPSQHAQYTNFWNALMRSNK